MSKNNDRIKNGVDVVMSDQETSSSSRLVETEDEYQYSPFRIGSTRLTSCPSKPNNIDISPSGSTLIRCDEFVEIINIRHGGMAPFLKNDNSFVQHRDAGKQIESFHSSVYIGHVSNVGIRGKVGKDGKVDLATYEKRFLHAQWSPLEFGPNASPFFATLTARRDIHLWYALDNQFNGPWQCLTCLTDFKRPERYVRDISIGAFTFLVPDSRSRRDSIVHLLATSQDENRAIIWQIRPDEYNSDDLSIDVVYDGTPEGYDLQAIYLLSAIHSRQMEAAGENRQLIAAVGPKGLVLLKFNANTNQLESHLWSNENEQGSYSSIFANVYVYHIQWSEETLCLYLCTAGQLFEVNFNLLEKTPRLPTYARLILKTINSDGDLIPNLKPIVGLQIDQGKQRKMIITLKDGSIYRHRAGFTRRKQAIPPCGEIEAPNSELHELQRDVEKKKGLYAFRSDDCGVAFLNFDNNEMNALSFIQHPTSTLDIALTEAQIAGINQSETVAPLSRAKAVIYEFVQLEKANSKISTENEERRARLLRHLSLHTERTIDRLPILQACDQAIMSCKEEPMRLKSAIQLCYWIKSFKGKELENDRYEKICEWIEELQLQSAFQVLRDQLKYNNDLLQLAKGKRFDDFSEMHCMRIAAITYCLALTMNQDVEMVETRLMDLKGVEFGSKLIREWKSKITKDPPSGIDIGERCPICDTPVLVRPSSPFQAKCMDGHPWDRCSTTFGLLCNVRALACTICCHQSILPTDATSDLQRAALQSSLRCALCGGTKVTI